jgi:protein tyrosine/serine phosphatase
MFAKLYKSLEDRERAWRQSFGNDISTPAKRRATRWHFNWVDHGILRVFWTNFFSVATGVYRSNQPSPERLEKYKAMGIKSVINLRGTSLYSHYLFEKESCDAQGLTLIDIPMSATALPTRETLLELDQHFKTLERPFLIHCKSGADRAGFAAALYQLLIDDVPIEMAQKQLSLKFLHIKQSGTGILDYCLEKYRKTNKASPIGFRHWMTTLYDPDAITAEFKDRRSGRAG